MRTYKQNTIELEPGESITIRCSDSQIEVRHNPDTVEEPNAPPIEVTIPQGNMLGLPYREDWPEIQYKLAGEDVTREELPGPLSIIVFSFLSGVVEGFTDEQVKYLQSIGVNHPDA